MAPLVSGLMVTRNRASLARRAVACFMAQTWANKELVIVDDGDEDYSSMLEPYRQRAHIIYERLRADPARTLGSARNISLDLARGDYCVQWDDDEWYHPQRIALQMAAICAGAEAVVLKYTLMHLDTATYSWHPYRACLRGGTPGTILHRRTTLRYPELRKNEDGVFLTRLRSELRVKVQGRSLSHLFIRCFHGGNTWEKEHFLRRLRTTRLDKWRYFIATQLRRDLFLHQAFVLNAVERESVRSFVAESRQLGLLDV
jgi:glycosyltransferase involved in cell wall biosynthesis